MKRGFVLLILTAYTGWLLAAGFELEDEAKEKKSEYRVDFYKSIGEVPFRFGQESKQRYQTLPANHRLRVESALLNEPSQPKPRLYVRSIVPVNGSGQFDGLEEIRARQWYPMNVIQTITWKNGVKDGPETIYGESAGNRTYVKKTLTWRDGRIIGEVLTFNESGQVTSKTPYQNGLAEGVFVVYDDDKRVIRKGTMKKDRRHGVVTDFWPQTGKPKRVLNYRDGRLDGTVKEYYLNNQLKKEIPFKNGKMHGVEKQYNDKGTLIQTRYWLDDEIVTRRVYQKAARP